MCGLLPGAVVRDHRHRSHPCRSPVIGTPVLGIGTGAAAFGVIGYLFMKRAQPNLPSSEHPESTEAVCRLPAADRAQRTSDFRRLFDHTLLERRRDGQDVVWRLRATELSERESHRLAALEARCCDGIRFDVKRHRNEVVWSIAGPPSAKAVLDAFYDLPVLVTTDRANELWAALDRASCGGATTR